MMKRHEAIKEYKHLKNIVNDLAKTLRNGCDKSLTRIALNDTKKRYEATMQSLKAEFAL